MLLLNVISVLLDYPDSTLSECEDEIIGIVEASDLSLALRSRLIGFIDHHARLDLLDWQAQYDALFERGRSLGLWLFEHVHGESRDRGQAMVDLVNMYHQAGLELKQAQLPDYIPLYLEFIATQGEENAKAWLLDVEHILALLHCRLEKRESDYAVLFEALLQLAGGCVNLNEIRAQVDKEKPDNTAKAIDKAWVEEEVTFSNQSPSKRCGQLVRRPSHAQQSDRDVPLNWVDPRPHTKVTKGAVK